MAELSDQEYEDLRDRVLDRHVINAERMLSYAKPQAFLFDQSIPLDAITFISGEPGGAKSWMAYSLAMCVARQRSWLGRPYVDGVGKGVLVLNYDNPTSLAAQRFKLLGMTADDQIYFHTTIPGRKPDHCKLSRRPPQVPDDAPRIDTFTGLERLEMIVGALAPRLILIDSFRQSHDTDENDSAEMATVLGYIKGLISYGAAALVIHHCAKAGAGLRGSGEILASADAAIEVSGDDDGPRTLYWTKHRGWTMRDEDREEIAEVVDVIEGEKKQVVVRKVE